MRSDLNSLNTRKSKGNFKVSMNTYWYGRYTLFIHGSKYNKRCSLSWQEVQKVLQISLRID